MKTRFKIEHFNFIRENPIFITRIKRVFKLLQQSYVDYIFHTAVHRLHWAVKQILIIGINFTTFMEYTRHLQYTSMDWLFSFKTTKEPMQVVRALWWMSKITNFKILEAALITSKSGRISPLQPFLQHNVGQAILIWNSLSQTLGARAGWLGSMNFLY